MGPGIGPGRRPAAPPLELAGNTHSRILGVGWLRPLSGIVAKRVRICGSTASRSSKPPQSSRIRWLAFSTTPIIRRRIPARLLLVVPERENYCSCVFRNHLRNRSGSLAPVAQQRQSSMTMKKTSPRKSREKGPDNLRSEYRFDYAASKLNRFAKQIPEGSLAILLDPDVARLFKDAESVNTVLRALIATMPQRRMPLR